MKSLVKNKIRVLRKTAVFIFFLGSIIPTCSLYACHGSIEQKDKAVDSLELDGELVSPMIVVGAERMDQYLFFLKDKKVALVANQASRVGERHLLDTLLSSGVEIQKIFTPEHGFRGKEDAGAKVESGVDPKTGIPLVSLYGSNKKPTAVQVEGLDFIVFDLQDVGVRFYTYLSTLHYIMQVAAENDISVLAHQPDPF